MKKLEKMDDFFSTRLAGLEDFFMRNPHAAVIGIDLSKEMLNSLRQNFQTETLR